MAVEILNEVKKAERTAKGIRQQGQDEARELLRRAETENGQYVKDKLHLLRKQAIELINDAEIVAKADYEKKKRRNNQRCEQLKHNAINCLEEAVAFIIGKVL